MNVYKINSAAVRLVLRGSVPHVRGGWGFSNRQENLILHFR